MKLIETLNTTQASVSTNANVKLGSIDKSVCQGAYNYNGTDTITLKQNGYYMVTFKADLESTAATQAMAITLYGNGSASAASATTYAATAGLTESVTLFKIVKVCGTPMALTFVNTGAAATLVNNTIVSIFKIA